MITYAFIILAVVSICRTDEDHFPQEMLEEHNKIRELYHAPPMHLEPELCKQAQEEAERRANTYAQTNSFGPPPPVDEDRSYNDNLWAQISYAKMRFNATKIVHQWAAQADEHDWKKNFFSSKTGHFTQMIWKSSDELGVGTAVVKNPKKQFVMIAVTRYSPPGNILDEEAFQDNVSPK